MYEYITYEALIALFMISSILAGIIHFFIKEMEEKSKYDDFLNDAFDGIENNFSSNNSYGYTNTNGIHFYKDEDGKLKVSSQSKLCGYSIEH